ncbi:MAG: hypothetical protein Q9207_004353 [Kuettlingeria erythrocarpa]
MVPAAVTRLQSIQNYQARVRKIVVDLGLQPTNFTTVMRSKVNYAGGAPRPMIKVHVRASDPTAFRQQSEVAKQQIQGLLTSNGVNGFSVEILDPNRVLVRSIFPLSPSDIFIRAFEAVSDRIVGNLNQRLGNKWTTLCLFKVGRTSEGSSYSVFVTVKPGTVNEWQRLQAQTQSIMDTELRRLGRPNLVGAVRADFVPGGQSEGAGPSSSHGKSFKDDLDGQPKLGCSIGLVGDSTGGGTLGGFFELQVGKAIHRGFLTNHHVVAPPKGAPMHRDHNRSGTVYGWAQGHPLKTKMHFFAEPDVNTTKQDIETAIAVNRDTLRQREESIRQRELAGMERSHLQEANRVNMGDFVNDLLKLRVTAAKLPQKLGHAIFSSGRAQTNDEKPRLIDWAFVSIDEFPEVRLSNHNRLPTTAELGNDVPDKYVRNVYYTAPKGPFQNFGSLEPGKWYFKKGRTTGITGGICHGTHVLTNAAEDPRGFFGPDGSLESAEADMINRVAMIVNSKALEPGAMQRAFCIGGDLGSLVFDADGVCCGLMSGTWSSETAPLEEEDWETDYWGTCVESGLVMDIADVQRWIAQRLTPRDTNGRPNGRPGRLTIPSRYDF